jgi:hypothetical protein
MSSQTRGTGSVAFLSSKNGYMGVLNRTRMVHNLHSPLLNKIQPISPLNPRGPAYMKAALKVLGLE